MPFMMGVEKSAGPEGEGGDIGKKEGRKRSKRKWEKKCLVNKRLTEVWNVC
jgi:hypothetical protein